MMGNPDVTIVPVWNEEKKRFEERMINTSGRTLYPGETVSIVRYSAGHIETKAEADKPIKGHVIIAPVEQLVNNKENKE